MPPKFSKEFNQILMYTDTHPDYQGRRSPCEVDCPAGNMISRFINLIQQNKFEEALESIMARNPFPGVCGRVCFHPCTSRCNRGELDEKIAINSLERVAFDNANLSKLKLPKKIEDTSKRVAIIGSGPAGMTCAYFSALLGHEVTLYEAMPELGGMLRVVPEYRLPKKVVDREIEQIIALGIHVETGVRVGHDISMNEITEKFDSCFVATGAWKPIRLNVPGEEMAISGLDFLRKVKSGEKPKIGKRVMVIGGGNTAFDCACTALRLGALEVHLACVEPKGKMPAARDILEEGEKEGVIIHNSEIVTKILSEKDDITGIECRNVKSFEFDDAGKLHVETIPQSEHVIPADTVIIAIGQVPDLDVIRDVSEIKTTKRQTIMADSFGFVTDFKGVFASGDVVTGPKSIVEAIGSGRLTAIAMDTYLLGRGNGYPFAIVLGPDGRITIERSVVKREMLTSTQTVAFGDILNIKYFDKNPQIPMKIIPYPQSIRTFEENKKGYGVGEAIEEANRCFHCGHCFKCEKCVEFCPGDVLMMNEDGPAVIYPEECWHCANCKISCPCGGIQIQFPLSMLI